MKKIIFLVSLTLTLSACSMEPTTLVGDAKEINGGNAELTLNGDSGHLLVQYNPSVQWKPINEDVKILKHESLEIEIQRPDGVKLLFVAEKSSPFVCPDCRLLYGNQIPTLWYRK